MLLLKLELLYYLVLGKTLTLEASSNDGSLVEFKINCNVSKLLRLFSKVPLMFGD